MNKITEQDLANRGVIGLPDVPGLTTEEMQRKLEEIAREILIPKVNELVEGLNNANSNLPKYFVGRIKTTSTIVGVQNIDITYSEVLQALQASIPVKEIISLQIIGVLGKTDNSLTVVRTITGGNGWGWMSIESTISQDIDIYCSVVYK